MMRRAHLLAFRRTLLEITGQIGPIAISQVWTVPSDLGGGLLELGSEDCFVTWTVESNQDQAVHTTIRRTGPASRCSVYVERGARVSCRVVQVSTGPVDQTTGILGAGVAVPVLWGRYYPATRPDYEGQQLPYLPELDRRVQSLTLFCEAGGLADRAVLPIGGPVGVGFAVGYHRIADVAFNTTGTVEVWDPITLGVLFQISSRLVLQVPVGPWGLLALGDPAALRNAIIRWHQD